MIATRRNRPTSARGWLLLLGIVAAACGMATAARAQDTGWTITSFDARIVIETDGDITVVEDIRVDFGSLERHGIFRDLPVRYSYDDDHDRVVPISAVLVDDGSEPVRFTSSRSGAYLRLKIGDPDLLVSGEQRYRIAYTASGALNAFTDHDELFWNVTGEAWPVPIEQARATVEVPSPGIESATCFQGIVGSQELCDSSGTARSVTYHSTRRLFAGEGLTIVAGLEKGLATVGPPMLAEAEPEPLERVAGYFEPAPAQIAVAVLVLLAIAAALGRLWWLIGRDRWYGDTYYLSEQRPDPETRPPFAHATIVVEYEPPQIIGDGRALRPAEIGLLLDERADTLDVSATIVDLAVRKYLVIKEVEKGGLLGIFKAQDYELERLEKPEMDLLPYERKLIGSLFDGTSTVKLSDLKGKFHEDLSDVKSKLYEEGVKKNKFFPGNPETVRNIYRVAGLAVLVGGGALVWALGEAFSAGFIALPVIIGGAALFALARAMPRRTALGWEMYRRCLGFRLFMVTAEADRQKFAEEANIFQEYLPYAIIYGCVERWAEVFEQLGIEPRQGGWYVGSGRFAPSVFAGSINSFSISIGSMMASTPGGSGGSGFGGGGSSGGGVGGGGGGSW